MATPATKQASEKKSFWAEHILTWQRSGLTQRAYCRQHGLSLSSLRYWRRRLDKNRDIAPGPSVTFVPVPLPAPSPESMGMPEPMLLHVGRDFLIEIRGDFTTAVLEKLVRTLKRL